ncbi:hypothetical protein QE152_g40677 [Popillia japonica]|uniref:Uncharacterized protein n=1 Tax=Popillia japonica TaxID=7064 RepID=A0AAW1HFH1_POPJA
MDRKTGHNCAARGCKNRRYHTGKESFFLFPKDIPRCYRKRLILEQDNEVQATIKRVVDEQGTVALSKDQVTKGPS